MPLEEKKYDIEANNDWAKNVKGEHLYIDQAESGRKGYFCIGCDKQMDAVIKKKNPNHRSYFRHIPVDVSKDESPCTFSNRKYREILATDILQRLKSIKVPSVYKYPLKDKDGAPMLLEKAKYISAHKVKSQLTFYEDSQGAVKFGKNPEIEERYLLIRPDVVFFNVKDEPILLVELVVTHKINEEKKIKLRRLGIDTVSIIIPRTSEQEIEDNFKTTKKVKWEYNGNEANTKYIHVPFGTGEGILEFDKDQRRIFEESLSCRKTRLNNTYRTIEKCLRSESYSRAEQNFRFEISRIEKATNEAEQKFSELERAYIEKLDSEFSEQKETVDRELDSIETRRRECRTQQENLIGKHSNLEGRYFKRREEIFRDEEEESRITEEHSELGRLSERIRKSFKFRTDRERENRAGIRKRINSLPEEFKQKHKAELQDFEELGNGVRAEIEEFGDFIIEEEKRIEREAESSIKSKADEIAREEKEFEQEFDAFKREESVSEAEVREQFEREFRGNPSKLSKGIRDLLEAERMGNDFLEAKGKEEDYKRAREFFRKGTWEKR